MMQKGPKRGGKASLGREVGLSQRTEVAAVFEQRWEVCGAFKVSINLLSAWACTEQQLWQQHPAHHHKGHCPAMASAIFGPVTQFPGVLLGPLCTGRGSIQDHFNAIDPQDQLPRSRDQSCLLQQHPHCTLTFNETFFPNVTSPETVR